MSLSCSSWEAQLDRRVGLLKFCLATKNQGLLNALIVQQFTNQNQATAADDNDDHKPHEGMNFAQILFQAASERVNILKSSFDVELNEFAKKANPDDQEQYRKLLRKLHETSLKEGKLEVDGLVSEVKRHFRDVPKEDREEARDLGIVLIETLTNFAMAQVVVVETLDDLKADQLKGILSKAFHKNESASKATKELLKAVTGVQREQKPRGFPEISPKAERLCIRKTENGWEISEIPN